MEGAHGQSDGPWETHARWWQDSFTEGADPEYEEQILPLAAEEMRGCRCVLDLGCGEGQVARRIAGAGASVTGVDPSTSQVVEAVRRGGGPRYLQASAGLLPFARSSFDGVVVCLVLEHVDELDAAVIEVARVLAPGGRLVLFLNHPLLQSEGSGWVDDHVLDPPEQYWRVGEYLLEQAYWEQVSPGVGIRFVHRPLGRYVNALADAGFVVERMLEPVPPAGFLERAPEYRAASSIPRLLVLRARLI